MTTQKTNPAPLVSIIMPVRNEGQSIRASLEAVLQQDYPRESMEVIVADGHSTDGSREIVASIAAVDPRVRVIDNRMKTVGAGLNLAMAQARGDVIIRIDGHCKVATDYVRRCVEHLERDGVDAVGGPIRTVGESRLGEVIAAATSSTFGVGDSTFRTKCDRTELADTVPFPAYTRAILQKAGAFDEELVRNQDDEYNYRLRKLGARVLLASDVTSEYSCRSSLRSLWQQYYEYGYWKVRVMQKHPRQMRWRHFVPPLFIATLTVSLLVVLLADGFEWFGVGILGAYLGADILVSLANASRVHWSHLPLLPLAFAAIHVAYGSGFLVGLIRFHRRWVRRGGWNNPQLQQ
ncbi:MAG: glycosyltransferase family 2 protein [Bacteroidota bacterium]